MSTCCTYNARIVWRGIECDVQCLIVHSGPLAIRMYQQQRFSRSVPAYALYPVSPTMYLTELAPRDQRTFVVQHYSKNWNVVPLCDPVYTRRDREHIRSISNNLTHESFLASPSSTFVSHSQSTHSMLLEIHVSKNSQIHGKLHTKCAASRPAKATSTTVDPGTWCLCLDLVRCNDRICYCLDNPCSVGWTSRT